MNKPLFSIIVPIYNVENYLEHCLESILNQTMTDYEIICIEDCSTDNSYEILTRRYGDYEQVRIVKNEENKGLSYSRNLGLEHSKGEYIIFLDSDDLLEKNALSQLEKIVSPSFDFINLTFNVFEDGQSVYTKINIPNAVVDDVIYKGTEGFAYQVESGNLIMAAWSRVYKKSFLVENKIKFIDGIYHEDVPFTFKAVLLAKSQKVVNYAFYNYRRRKGSITRMDSSPKHIQGYFIGYLDSLSFWNEHRYGSEIESVIEKYLQCYYLECIQNHLYYHQVEDIIFHDAVVNHRWRQTYFYNRSKRLEDLAINRDDKLIIYGAGKVASKAFYDALRCDVEVLGFAVTKMEGKQSFLSHKVKCIDDYVEEIDEKVVVLLATSDKFINEIKLNLQRLCIKDYKVYRP